MCGQSALQQLYKDSGLSDAIQQGIYEKALADWDAIQKEPEKNKTYIIIFKNLAMLEYNEVVGLNGAQVDKIAGQTEMYYSAYRLVNKFLTEAN